MSRDPHVFELDNLMSALKSRTVVLEDENGNGVLPRMPLAPAFLLLGLLWPAFLVMAVVAVSSGWRVVIFEEK